MPESIIVFWQIFKLTWQIWVAIFIIALIPILFEYLLTWFEEWRYKKWLQKHKKLEDWKKLDGREFEKIVAIVFKNLGYKTKLRGGPKDRGIDIEVTKEGKRHFIQCKKMDIVPPKFIREFYGSIVDKLQDEEKGLLVTTGIFTGEGYIFIKDKPIELIDGLKLEKLVKK